MAVSVDQFAKALVASGLLSADHVKDIWTGLSADVRPAAGEGFAKLLVERGELTAFQAQELLAGRGARLVLGDYAILKEIGVGGMGRVYQAKHVRMDRIVALKVMTAQAMKDADAVKRFQREVQAAARLEHPNIVTAYASGEAGSIKYLVMQFVDGGDLSSLVKTKGPLAVERAVDYASQAACGLAYAHGEGVIHRDIKPANLLVDKKGVVKILDMGLARFEDGGDGLTATEQVMGTVDYMSPEQAANTRTADARADVYSLGCTLWFLLTGKKLYESDTMIGRLMAHRDAPLPSLTKVRDDASWPLEQVLQRMIAKRADDRLQTMDDVVAALAPFGPSGAAAGAGMGSSLGLGPSPHDAELASFLQGTAVQTATKDSPSKNKTNIAATVTWSSPESGTDSSRPAVPTTPPTHLAAGLAPARTTNDARGQAPRLNKKGPPVALVGGGVAVAVLAVGTLAWLATRGGDAEPPPVAPIAVRPPSPPPTVVEVVPGPRGPQPYDKLESTKYVWTEPRNVGRPVNDAMHNRHPALSADELCLIVNTDGPQSDLREFHRAAIDEPWGDGVWHDGANYEREPALSADGLTLLFTSEAWKQPGYVGGWDLWMRRRPSRDAPWSAPENLGPQVNSSSDEGGPALSADGLSLAFHSKRPGGSGDFDLWISRRASPTAPFGPPQNLGRTINHPGGDYYPRFLSADGTLLFERGGDLYVTFRNALGAVGALALPNQPEKFYGSWLSPDATTLYFHRDGRPGGRGLSDIWMTRRVLRDSPEAKAPPPTAEEAAPLPKIDAVAYAGHSYQWVPGEMTWFEAQSLAEALGGHLVTIDTPDENNWLKETLIADLPEERMVWIGLLKEQDGGWRWSTGEPLGFVDWRPGEGNDNGVIAGAFAHGPVGKGWGDWPANSIAMAQGGELIGQSRSRGCLVEWDAPTPTPAKPPEPLIFNGHRYLLVKEPLDWYAAREKAESLGGHLVTVETQAERDWLRHTIWPRVPTIEGNKRFYLGAFRESHESPWRWVPDRPMDMQLWLGRPADGLDQSLTVVTWMDAVTWDDVGPRWKPFPYVIEWDDAAAP